MPVLTAPNDELFDGPGVFLGGPIKGGPQWHQQAIRLITRADPRLYVCSPRREIQAANFDDVERARQIDWETRYLRRCADHGVLLFWLAAEEQNVPGRAYAQTSRYELAEWKERHRRGEARLAIGIDAGFSGARYLRYRLGQECPRLKLHETLEETCLAAIVLARL